MKLIQTVLNLLGFKTEAQRDQERENDLQREIAQKYTYSEPQCPFGFDRKDPEAMMAYCRSEAERNRAYPSVAMAWLRAADSWLEVIEAKKRELEANDRLERIRKGSDTVLQVNRKYEPPCPHGFDGRGGTFGESAPVNDIEADVRARSQLSRRIHESDPSTDLLNPLNPLSPLNPVVQAIAQTEAADDYEERRRFNETHMPVANYTTAAYNGEPVQHRAPASNHGLVETTSHGYNTTHNHNSYDSSPTPPAQYVDHSHSHSHPAPSYTPSFDPSPSFDPNN
jgi:hypothetical protein